MFSFLFFFLGQILGKGRMEIVSRICVRFQVGRKLSVRPLQEVPGPRGWPLIGTLLDYINKDGPSFGKMFEARIFFSVIDYSFLLLYCISCIAFDIELRRSAGKFSIIKYILFFGHLVRFLEVSRKENFLSILSHFLSLCNYIFQVFTFFSV